MDFAMCGTCLGDRGVGKGDLLIRISYVLVLCFGAKFAQVYHTQRYSTKSGLNNNFITPLQKISKEGGAHKSSDGSGSWPSRRN
jgi:hypothetical protein